MKGKEQILQRITERVELSGEPIPGQPVIEIGGENRVLIENYSAVREYNPQRICVLVKYGSVTVAGCGLELRRITKEQLVIAGRIDGVTLHRRK